MAARAARAAAGQGVAHRVSCRSAARRFFPPIRWIPSRHTRARLCRGQGFRRRMALCRGQIRTIAGGCGGTRPLVDIIVTGLTAAIRPLQKATSTIPIVMAYSVSPVGNGLVASLARTGGNITGLTGSTDDTTPKQLELLAAVVVSPSRIALLGNPDSPTYPPVRKSALEAAKKAGLLLVTVEARNPQETENAFAAFVTHRVRVVLVASDAIFPP